MKTRKLVQGMVLAGLLLGQGTQAHAEGFFGKLLHKHECKSTYMDRQRLHDHTAGHYDCSAYDKKRSDHEKKMAKIKENSDKSFGSVQTKKPKGLSVWSLFQDSFK